MTDVQEQYEDPRILRLKKRIKELDDVNSQIRRMLDKLPLKHHREIARLNYLITKQQRLITFSVKHAVPPRVKIFFDNAKDTAVYLRAKYSEAINKGKLRKPE